MSFAQVRHELRQLLVEDWAGRYSRCDTRDIFVEVTPTMGHSTSRHASFPQTAWTLVGNVQGMPNEQRAELLGVFLEPYRRPVHAYFRWRGIPSSDAEDLVQDLFFKFLSRPEVFDGLEAGKGRFRNWIRACANNLMIDRMRGRGASDPISCVDVADSASDFCTHFNAVWRREIVQNALESVRLQCKSAGRLSDFQAFVEYYCADGAERVTWQEIALRLGLSSWKDASRKSDWVKRQLRKEIRKQIGRYMHGEEDIDDELRDLLN